MKIAHLDRLQYIICHLGYSDGARARILADYNSVDRNKHSRATRALCDGGPLTEAMDAMTNSTDLVNDGLRVHVHAIREMPLNDEVMEMPHAAFSKRHRHVNSATFAWKVASVKLSQKLRDAEQFPATCNVDFQKVFDNFTQLLQTKHRLRPKKMHRSEFIRRMYKCNEEFTPDIRVAVDVASAIGPYNGKE